MPPPIPKSLESHPAHQLSIGLPEMVASLARLHPVTLPNHGSLQTDALVALRTLPTYIYVVLWLYQCRGYIKLHNEYFDVDIFELELLDHFPLTTYLMSLADYDADAPNNLFITKLKLALITCLQQQKLSLLANFERVVRLWFGVNTPLGGTEVEDEHGNFDVIPDANTDVAFDALNITDKFTVLQMLIAYILTYLGFRRWVETQGFISDQLRPELVLVLNLGHRETQHQLYYNDTFIYTRTVLFPELQVPKKRKNAPADPNDAYKPLQFDVSAKVTYKLVVANVYELALLIKQLKLDKNKDHKALAAFLADPDFVDNVLDAEIRKRKFIGAKRKELELAGMIALRKRLGRLEARARREEEERKLQEAQEAEMKLGAEKRIERRRHQRDLQLQSELVTREARIKRRREEMTPQPDRDQEHKVNANAATSAPAGSHQDPSGSEPPIDRAQAPTPVPEPNPVPELPHLQLASSDVPALVPIHTEKSPSPAEHAEMATHGHIIGHAHLETPHITTDHHQA